MIQDPFGLDAAPPLSVKFVQPNNRAFVVLERITAGVTPDYCVHGRTKCLRCNTWCHLGSETGKIVERGEASPLCVECAVEAAKPGGLIASVRDHRRADGPHQ